MPRKRRRPLKPVAADDWWSDATIAMPTPSVPADDWAQPTDADDTPDDWDLPSDVQLTDEQVVILATNSKDGSAFKKLMAGDTSAQGGDLTKAYETLCHILAFWTRSDTDQLARIVAASGLNRAVWANKEFRDKIIAHAIAERADFIFTPKPCYAKKSPAGRLVALIRNAAIDLFHDRDKVAYATISVADHLETHELLSPEIKGWASLLHHEKEGEPPQALKAALTVLEEIARREGAEHPVSVRLAGHDEKVYIDLCDSTWQAVEIDAAGWRVTSNPAVKFRRADGMLALPAPERGGSLAELRPFVNVSDSDWPLVLAWLVAAMRPTGPFPLMVLHGEQGNAKSTTARVLRSLIDPNSTDRRDEPREKRDLAIWANNGWIIDFDNMSVVKDSLSDALCRLATGGGFSVRSLFRNKKEALFHAQRPVIMNGIEVLATRGDLLDRAILVECHAIPKTQRRSEAELWAAFEQARPRILGALCAAVAVGLRNLRSVTLAELPRMADFAKWGVACEPAFGLPAGAFITAYEANRLSATETALEASPVAAHAIAFARVKGSFEGTASQLLAAFNSPDAELLAELKTFGAEDARHQAGWPKNAQVLSAHLRRLAPNLRRKGIELRFTHDGTKRVIAIRALGPLSASRSQQISDTSTNAPNASNERKRVRSKPAAAARKGRHKRKR